MHPLEHGLRQRPAIARPAGIRRRQRRPPRRVDGGPVPRHLATPRPVPGRPRETPRCRSGPRSRAPGQAGETRHVSRARIDLSATVHRRFTWMHMSLAQHRPALTPHIALRVRRVALGSIPVAVVLVAAHGRQHDGARGWQQYPVQYGHGQSAAARGTARCRRATPRSRPPYRGWAAGSASASLEAGMTKAEAAKHQPHRLERCTGLPGRETPRLTRVKPLRSSDLRSRGAKSRVDVGRRRDQRSLATSRAAAGCTPTAIASATSRTSGNPPAAEEISRAAGRLLITSARRRHCARTLKTAPVTTAVTAAPAMPARALGAHAASAKPTAAAPAATAKSCHQNRDRRHQNRASIAHPTWRILSNHQYAPAHMPGMAADGYRPAGLDNIAQRIGANPQSSGMQSMVCNSRKASR